MSDKGEYAGAMHAIAAKRRAEGRPIWDRTIKLGDVFHDESRSFEERRDAIVDRIRKSGWLTDGDDYEQAELVELVDELAEADDVEEFDRVWNAVYDQADVDRVWIETITR